MEKVAAGVGAGVGSRCGSLLGRVSLALGCCVAGAGWAQTAPTAQEVLVAQARPEPAMQVEVSASTLPRIDPQDNGFQAPRVDLSLAPQSQGLGVVVGMSGFASRAGQQPNFQNPQNSMDLGLRWRQVLLSKQVDLTAWRRMSNDQDAFTLIQQRQPVYGARVEMRLADAASHKAGFTTGQGFLGFQMESGARIQIRRKDGRPMIYYRQSF